jgi:hypothetical protein
MADEQQNKLPPFEAFATTTGFLRDDEIDRLIAEHAAQVQEAKLAVGHNARYALKPRRVDRRQSLALS